MEDKIREAVVAWHDYAKAEATKAFGSWEAALAAAIEGRTNGHIAVTLEDWLRQRGFDPAETNTRQAMWAALAKVTGH